MHSKDKHETTRRWSRDRILKYAIFHDLRIGHGLRENFGFMMAIWIMLTIQMITLIPVHIPEFMPTSKVHRIFYSDFIRGLLSVFHRQSFYENNNYFVIFHTLIFVAKHAVFWVCYTQASRDPQKRQTYRGIFLIIGGINVLNITAAFNWYTQIWIYSFFHTESVLVKVCTVMNIIMILIDCFTDWLFGYDFKFQRTNYLWDRSYQVTALRVLASLTLSTYSILHSEGTTPAQSLTQSALAAVFGLLMLISQLSTYAYFLQFRLGRFIVAFLVLILVESLVGVFTNLGNPIQYSIDFDYLACITLIASWATVLIVQRRIKESAMGFITHDRIDVDKMVLGFEVLYNTFHNKQHPRERFNLLALLHHHTSSCERPHCLCFLIRIHFPQHLDPRNVLLTAKGRGLNQSRELGSNFVTIFDDEDLMRKLKYIHFREMRSTAFHKSSNKREHNMWASRIMGSPLTEFEPNWIINEYEANYFCLMLCSWYSILLRSLKGNF